jgi:RimJ/RimL family protein N-acetyltransferase
MNISFEPLSQSHFSLLLKWLKTPHVKLRWDQDIIYTEESIREKYLERTQGYKLENDETKAIHSYIIYVNNKPIGYIQIYNAYDFTRKIPLVDLPKSLGSIDFYIGNIDYIGKGIGVEVLKVFDYQGYKNILVDPDMNNIAAIKTYERVGFKKIKEYKESNEILMLKENG